MLLSGRLDAYTVRNDALSARLDSIKLDIGYFMYAKARNDTKLTNLISSHAKVIFQISGSSVFNAEGQTFELGRGDAAIIPPYSLYSGEAVNDVVTYEIFFNISPVTQEQELLSLLGIERTAVFPNAVSETSMRRLATVYAAVQGSLPGSRKRLEAMLTGFLLSLPGRRPAAPKPCSSTKEQELIFRLLAYIETHMSENISVEELCAEFDVSPSFLYRCSTKVMNCSTVQIISRAKLKHAKLLLRDPSLSVGDIAAAIGYDLFYFSSRFRKQFGISPSDYRKTLHAEKK